MSTAVQRTRVVAAQRAPRTAAQPASPAPVRRTSLEVVPRSRRIRRRRLAPLLSAGVVSFSLLLVVLGHAELAQGQVRLANVQAEITSARLAHQREVVGIANLENPTRILKVAENSLHMAPPSQVHQLAHVPLQDALPAAHVAPSTGTSPAQPAASGG